LSPGDEDGSADRTEFSSTRSYKVTPAGPVCVRRAAVLTQATPKSVGIRTVSQPVGPAKPDTQSGLSEVRSGFSSVWPDYPLVGDTPSPRPSPWRGEDALASDACP